MQAEMLIAFGLLALLLAATEIGFRYGRRAAQRSDSHAADQIGVISGALLGLLGLLLGFSFAGAAGRFLDRQDLIVTEANAIGTAYLRADLLDEPQRAELRTALAQYLDHRLHASTQLRSGLTPEIIAQVAQDHDRIWRAAVAGATARPAVAMLVVPPVNDVIDLHTTRLAAGKKHLPVLLMLLLTFCSAMAMCVIGYGCGIAGRRRALLVGALAILLAAALWTTIDLDYGRIGLIQLSDAALHDLKLN